MLRPNELATIVLGTLQFTVPPRSTRKTVQAYCDGKCTERLGTSAITVRDVSFHMHGHGQAVKLRVVRGSAELQPLAVLEPFNVANSALSVNRQLLPGDSLILECVYTNDLDVPITYGGDLNQEMCFGFLTIIGACVVLLFRS
jgi:hypothetical protein